MNCPYCGKYDKYSYTTHARTCRYNPAVIEVLRQILPSPSSPGCIRTSAEYEHARLLEYPSAPSIESVRKQYGSWNNLAREFGLEVRDRNGIRIEEKVNATKVALEELSIRLYGGEYAPSQNDYRKNVYRAGTNGGPITCDVLVQKYGKWESVLEYFGITAPIKPYEPKRKRETQYTPVSISDLERMRYVFGIGSK